MMNANNLIKTLGIYVVFTLGLLFVLGCQQAESRLIEHSATSSEINNRVSVENAVAEVAQAEKTLLDIEAKKQIVETAFENGDASVEEIFEITVTYYAAQEQVVDARVNMLKEISMMQGLNQGQDETAITIANNAKLVSF